MNSNYPHCIIKETAIDFLDGKLIHIPTEYRKPANRVILTKFYTSLLTKNSEVIELGVDPIGFNYIVLNNCCNVGLLFEGDNSSLYRNNRKKYPKNIFDTSYLINQVTHERKLENYESFIPVEIVTQNMHEIRNLNSKISAHIDALLNADDDSAWETTFDSADENIKKIYVASRLIKFILDIVKFNIPNHIENIKINYERSFVIHKSVNKIVKIYSNDFKKKRSNIRFDGTSYKQLKGDKELFEIVLMLLVENAIKYSNEPVGMPPRVNIRNNNIMVIITISSFGRMIPNHERTKLFSRGFRSEIHIKSNDGTGMGLHNAYKILQHFKAELKYESTSCNGDELGWNNFIITCNETID